MRSRAREVERAMAEFETVHGRGPNDDELAAQLAALRYAYTSRGQILIESKDDMKKRGMPSPDRADAVMLAAAKVNLPDSSVHTLDELLTDDDGGLAWAASY